MPPDASRPRAADSQMASQEDQRGRAGVQFVSIRNDEVDGDTRPSCFRVM